MKPGPEENCKLVDFKFLGVKLLCTFPKKREIRLQIKEVCFLGIWIYHKRVSAL